ncbi:uncharacterized protein LOC121872923 [Homarus americanus]|uniref:uncharacterized protein LOC121872923 n=1 Tax=Homarus americanus TaxID=6706 RepID=UPI001C470536|nr:uncharacterized protein LOC121872923 [Homarus americanus]
MEEAVTCQVCSDVYQSGLRDPLVLCCGHTFCRSCLSSLRVRGDFNCPSCRRDLDHIDLEDLPICFSLLGLASSYTHFQCETCSDHGGDLTYWCRGCNAALCGLCLYSSHPQNHDVQLAKVCLQEKKHALQGQIKQYSQVLIDKKKIITDKASSYFIKLKRLCINSNRLHDAEKDVAAISEDVEEVCNIDNMIISEVKLKSLQIKHRPIVAEDDDETETDHVAEGLYSNNIAEENSQGDAASACHHNTINDDFPVDRRRARLDSCDGKLLLHTISARVDSRLFLQLPTEVFLELSVGKQSLGRVYIELWTHLRRAQQFLALCLGSLGSSYVGASFVVTAHNQERETLDVRRYVLPDGSTSNRILMSDLEWGGRFSGPAKKRTVMGSFYGTDTHGFGICTRGQPLGTFQCPFGRVSSGMGVVEVAVRHNPITEVTITDCGIVIPDLIP